MQCMGIPIIERRHLKIDLQKIFDIPLRIFQRTLRTSGYGMFLFTINDPYCLCLT